MNSGAPGVVNTTGFGMCAVTQDSPTLRMKTLYEPAPKPLNVFVVCQIIPSILYSVATAAPSTIPAKLLITISPSSVSQFDGSVTTTVANGLNVGATGAVRITSLFAYSTSQVPFS